MNEIIREGSHRFRRHVLHLWESRGGGFYGFVAVLTFLYLEAIDLVGDVMGAGGFLRMDLGWVIGWMVQNFVDALLNLVFSAIWPVEWVSRFGVGVRSGLLLLGAYGLYRLLRPAVLRWLREPDAELDPAATTPRATGVR